MRVITVTGGFSGSVVVDLADSLRQLVGVTFRLGLAPVGQDDPPPVDSPTWSAATADPQTAAAATVSLVVDGTTATGHYNLAVDVIDGADHEVAWVMDSRNRRLRALVAVT